MKYRNEKTGAVINVESVVRGGAWKEVKPPSKPPANKKRAVKKENG